MQLSDDKWGAKRLSGQYPKEIVELYWRETASYVKMGKEPDYAHAVGVLKEIRQIMKSNQWTDEGKTRYQAFLEEHRRKKLLLRLLEGSRHRHRGKDLKAACQ